LSSENGSGVTEIEILEVVGLEEDEQEPEERQPPQEPAATAVRSQPPAPRHAEMRERGRLEATVALLRELLPALDDLERCVRSRPDQEQLEQGVKLALRGLWDVFRRRELERIEGEGRPFDPAIHEAVAVTPTDRVPPNTVIELMRVGYRLGNELVRPALVRVSGESVPDPDAESEADDETRGEQ
jgi:molecular chaperone GrpE